MGVWRYLLVLLASFMTLSARAEDGIGTKERAAKTACLAGDFAKGVAILSDLYVRTSDVVFLFNQGRCFEQNHRYEDAISRFQEYLRVGKRISNAHKADAQKHIANCRKLLSEQGGASTGTPALAAESREAKERAARKACLTGDPVTGVGILTDLFIDTHDTTYLFNQGRCFEQNRRYEDAIGRFHEYLMKAKNLSPEDRADTQKHIAACESFMGAKPGEAPSPEGPKNAAENAKPPESIPSSPIVTVAESKPAETGAGLRTTGLVLASLGGAALIAGVVLNLKVNSMSSDLESEYDSSVDSSRRTYKTATWFSYGAGAACLAGGAVLYYLGWRRGYGGSTLSLVPTFGPDAVGTALAGRF